MSDSREFGGRTPSPREPDERLADWVDGCMSDRDRERFTAELRVNPQLRADLAAYERTVATLRQALQAPTAPLPRRDHAGGGTTLADRVLAQAQGQAPVRSFRRAVGGIAWRPVLWSLASAAALLLLTLGLDSWSAEPAATRETARLQLDPLPVLTGAPEGAAMPLEQGRDSTQWSAPDQSAAAAAATATAAELAQQRAQNEVAGFGAVGATKPEQAPAARELSREVAPFEAPIAVDPQVAPVVGPEPSAPAAGAPAPTRAEVETSPAKPESEGGPGTGDAVVRRGSLAPGRLADGTDPAKPASPTAPGSDGAVVDSPRTGRDDFYLGGSWKAAATPWPLLIIEGGQAAPAAGAAKSRSAAAGPAGPSTAGPSPAASAPPSAGAPTAVVAPVLEQAQLEARIDAFLADAVEVDAVPTMVLPTANGTLRLVRVPLAEDLASPVPADQPIAAALLEASWAVDGPQDAVAVLLRRLHQFARAPGRSLRSGETTPPVLPPLPAASASAEASAGQRQLVLRFRLRPR